MNTLKWVLTILIILSFILCLQFCNEPWALFHIVIRADLDVRVNVSKQWINFFFYFFKTTGLVTGTHTRHPDL